MCQGHHHEHDHACNGHHCDHAEEDGTIRYKLEGVGGIDIEEFFRVRRWLDSFLDVWSHSRPEDELMKRFFKSMRPVEEIKSTVSLVEFLTYHKCKTDNCDCIAEFKRTRNEYERQYAEFEALHQRDLELDDEIEQAKIPFFMETEANGLLEARRKFAEIIKSGDIGKIPNGFAETKECAWCDAVLPRTLKFFAVEHKYSKDGLKIMCRVCAKKANRWNKSDVSTPFIQEKKAIAKAKKELPFKVCPTCKLIHCRKTMDPKRSHCRACKVEWMKWDKRLKENPDRDYWDEIDREFNERMEKMERRAVRLNEGVEYRKCPLCNQLKPANVHFFYLKERSADGLSCACRLCDFERIHVYKHTDPQEIERRKQEQWNAYAAENSDNEERYCPSCDTWHPKDRNHWNLDYTTEDGYRRYCKICMQEHHKDPKNSKLSRYQHEQKMALWTIYRENYAETKFQRCGCCKVSKPWDPEYFKWSLGKAGLPGTICHECIDSGRNLIDEEVQIELRKQGLKRCDRCFCDKKLDEYRVDRGYEYAYCHSCYRDRANLYQHFRRKTNPVAKAVDKIGGALLDFIRKHGLVKDFHTAQVISCDYKFLMEHLGRSGLNVCEAGIHIDHLIPVAWAIVPGDDEQTLKNIKLFYHWSNLRLMRASDNCSKGDRPVLESELPDYLHPEIRAFYDRKIAELKAVGKEIDYYVG